MHIAGFYVNNDLTLVLFIALSLPLSLHDALITEFSFRCTSNIHPLLQSFCGTFDQSQLLVLPTDTRSPSLVQQNILLPLEDVSLVTSRKSFHLVCACIAIIHLFWVVKTFWPEKRKEKFDLNKFYK